jgi:hypothetical protein
MDIFRLLNGCATTDRGLLHPLHSDNAIKPGIFDKPNQKGIIWGG